MNLITETTSEGGAIYLGNIDAASIFCVNYCLLGDINLLQSHRIGAVLSLCPDPIPSNVKSRLMMHSFHYVEDCDEFNISTFFDITYEFIERARK